MGNLPSVMPGIGEELFETGIIGIIYLLYMLAMMALSAVIYVVQAVSLYTIAKRRGIHNPWLSWIPVGNGWILGSISDQYQYVVKGKTKSKRKALLVLNILLGILSIVVLALYVVLIWSAIDGTHSWDSMGAVAFFVMIPVALAVMGLSVAMTVVWYIALYDLYMSCEPKNAALYLILGVLVSITQPIFLFICRNKDLGMPPRKPVSIPQLEPIKEPWENNE